MKRIDKIAELLTQYSEKQPVTASEMAEQLQITRANVSSDLNQLVKLGKAKKIGTKPVYFFSTTPTIKNEENILDDFIKKSPSLFHCGEQAKAAILYPPNGMHILLTGETGVGKSMFAELIYTYALVQNKLKADSNFITFNCADYANNPQLLVGSIFGVLKGAYTGADHDRVGLLEKANGGILFLDEIHRLPPEGQEMLFTFIDRGIYRRLGETNSERQAQVLLVCATTEDTSSSLLQTFIRRIPMRIEIPSLVDRGLEERLNLIATFFQTETKKLRTPIEVSTNTIRALLGYHCPNNVGQLKADIQLLCAKAYSQFIARQEETIKISSYELPHYIREGLYNTEDRKKIWLLLPNMNTRFFLFNEEETTLFLPKETKGNDIYQIIEQKMSDMERIGLNISQTSEIIDTTITNYYRSYNTDSVVDLNNLEQIVGSEIVATANKVCEKASRLLTIYLSDNVRYGLALHLYNTIQRVKRGQTIINPRIVEIKQEHPRLFDAAQHCLSVIESDFSIRLPEDEAGFLALFFTSDESKSKKRTKVEVIVVAHGESTATSMANVVNKLLGEQIAIGFDMNLEEKPIVTLTNIQNYLSAKNQLKDVLLLVDMGSLINFSDELEKNLNIQIRCIELVSTLHVLEASRKASLGHGLNEVFESTKNIRGLSTYKKNYEEQKPGKLYILTLCTTGEGSAQLIKKMLDNRLNLRGGACEIVSLQITDERLLEQTITNLSCSGKIICTIGTFQLSLASPHFSITDALDETKTKQIQSLIDYEIAFEGMRTNIANMLVYKDGEQLIVSIREWVETMAAQINPDISYEIKVGLACHIVCMIDRLKQGKNVSCFPQTSTFQEKFAVEIASVQKNSQFLETYYAITIPKDEIFYITAFFMNESFL
ncbi:sigma 54-interacting transcriptional regulator [Enterococcus ureasiticus]|uniref:sigma 54-interacting transcriptional regulator n=1 Tax=Enterococcus ureasiticus TaxID=903984 RepID=UPI001A8CE769|nr:sigma-54-dependent transcriptional regulator [Enterococcus ureasiticus]MBO0475368.1 sigma 54-interacting transcriptional regulator [Enterococcus ureasiticus]